MLPATLFLAVSLLAGPPQHVPAIHRATDPIGGCFDFEKASVSLTGAIFTRIYFGPPNYGERPATDGREEQALLLLDAPICVRGGSERNSKGEENVVVVQLAAISVPPNIVYDVVGHRVEVKGRLFHAETGHHRTPVLIDVATVKTLD